MEDSQGNSGRIKRIITILSILFIITTFVGGTLAYIFTGTDIVINIFHPNEIEFNLRLEENTQYIDSEYTDRDVDMPTETDTQSSNNWYTIFELDKIPRLIGYTFEGWYLDEECLVEYDTDSYTSIEVEYSNDAYNKLTNSIDTTLYAKWELNDNIKVSFDTQSSISSPDDITVTWGEEYGSLPIVSNTGYTFAGWSLEPDGTDIITENSIVELDTDHTLYAIWASKPYRVTFYGGNSAEGSMGDQILEYDVPAALNKNMYSRPGYKFMGWSTSPNGDAEYIDEQIVVNLLESGTIKLYAVWAENTYTVTFDYNDGYGSPDSKEVIGGKEYGVLPTYPTKYQHLFAGWYTAPTGGTRVYPDDIADYADETLYAHWIYSPANEIILDLVIKNNPDDNKDGIVDDIYLNFECSSYFEKFNVPIEDLIVGQKYKLTFTESNDATFGNSEKGYGGAIYGSIITVDGSLEKGSIKTEAVADGGLIAQWSDRPNGDEWLNGPRNWEMTFTAEAETMYWTWDMGLIMDGYLYNYNFKDIKIEPIAPSIKFSNKSVLKPDTSTAKIVSQTNSKYSTAFEFDGDSGCETVYYPITGLTAGATYTITFDHTFTGNLIDSTKYDYGCGIMTTVPTSSTSKMSNMGTFASDVFILDAVSNGTESVTLTFTAAGDTAYWVWNMANCSDSTNGIIDIEVTEFSVKHSSGDRITYYETESNADTYSVMMLSLDELEYEMETTSTTESEYSLE